ncbi:hypothetical protein [Paludisphaera rhizosphaerae]|uniref:hypothetical protein n=1 Tax=Paludisphaera rhizosphaerae TaxID=2711216 RepID=UPI0013ED44BA|nr:hypothetical protein [Paludisphaera rhizosphaerae]
MNRVTCRKGVDGSSITVALQRRGVNGGYVDDASTFTADDPLTCVLWPGGDLASVATLPASWVSADDGAVQVDFPASAFADLAPGIYRAAVRLATDPPVDLAYLEVELEAGPATGTARPVYITSDDLQEEFPNLESMLGHVDTDQTGFAKLRADARDWLDLLVLSHYRPSDVVGPLQFSIPWIPAQPETNAWLADYLAGDCLLLTTPNGRRLIKAQTYWVLGRIFRRAANASASAGNLLDMASHYEMRASDTIATSIAEIDTNDDGSADLTISLRTTVTRRR